MKLRPPIINYRVEQDPLTGKYKKIPCDKIGRNINPFDPKNWVSEKQAKEFAQYDLKNPNKPYGVGLVLNGDGLCALDIDNARDENGDWLPDAVQIYDLFRGAAAEVSISGNGIHIFFWCDPEKVSHLRNRWSGKSESYEFYSDNRFIALSRGGLTPIGGQYLDKDFSDVVLEVVPARETVGTVPDQTSRAGAVAPEDDDAVIEKMLASRSASAGFGERASVRDLWTRNELKLRQFYPCENRPFDESRADQALMVHLAFWTGHNRDQMDRLFRRSALVREKYMSRPDYRKRTIDFAVANCSDAYSPSHANITELHADMSHDELAYNIYVRFWAGNMLHIPECDRWAMLIGSRWIKSRTKHDQIVRLRRELRNIPDEGVRSKRKRLGDNKTIMAVNKLMETNEGAVRHSEKWDEDPVILGTPSSIVDLRTGHVRPRRSTDFLLCSTSVDPAPIGSNPTAWLHFIEAITGGDKELEGFLQRWAGYAATGSTKEQKFFFFYGTGRNGKSTFLNVLMAVLSEDYAKTVSPTLLLAKAMTSHSTDLADIAGARLVRGSEIGVGESWNTPIMKIITGGDAITARKMRQDNKTFVPTCTLVVDANNAPSIKGMDEAIRRRMCLIPFKTTIPQSDVDPDLFEKLMKEKPAILRWIIDGAVKWNRDGLKVPNVVKQASEDYIESEDDFGLFLEEYFVKDHSQRVSYNVLYGAFGRYAQRSGMPAWSKKAIGKEMRKRGFERYKSDAETGFRGLRLNQTKICSHASDIVGVWDCWGRIHLKRHMGIRQVLSLVCSIDIKRSQ